MTRIILTLSVLSASFFVPNFLTKSMPIIQTKQSLQAKLRRDENAQISSRQKFASQILWGFLLLKLSNFIKNVMNFAPFLNHDKESVF